MIEKILTGTFLALAAANMLLAETFAGTAGWLAAGIWCLAWYMVDSQTRRDRP